MMNLRNFSCLLLALCASAASAQQKEGGGEELVEKVVVRNRLYNVEGRFEAGVNVGFSMLSRLTEHYNFNASGAYNFMESLALELRVGYALSNHTSLADGIAITFFDRSKEQVKEATDLSDLWEMKFNAIVGLRWQPIYGKLGLMAELPVHFQFYLWLGGGVGMLDRTSVMICNEEVPVLDDNGNPTSKSQCGNYLKDSKVSPLVSLAIGFRFFLTENHVVRFEIRDWSWIDNYLACANRKAALNPATPTGEGGERTTACPNGPQPRSGLTNLVQIDLGYTYIF